MLRASTFEEGELDVFATIKDFLQVQLEECENEVFEINGLKSAKRQMQAVATKVKNFTLTISG